MLAAALASLADNDYVTTCRARSNDTRRWLCAELTKDSRAFIPSHGNFVMIDMGADTKPFIDQFRARNILVGRRFASMPNFLRVTIGTQAGNRSIPRRSPRNRSRRTRKSSSVTAPNSSTGVPPAFRSWFCSCF